MIIMKDLKYLLAYSIPLSAVLALQWQGWWSWATVVLAFGVFPLLDAMIPASTANYTESEEKSRLFNRFFDILLYLCAPICFILVYFYFQTILKGGLAKHEWLGLTFSTGVVLGALGINVAHELGHRTNKWEQFLAKAGLLPVLYQHFFIEHNRGHHKHVSTDQDPATAKKNEWVYSFFFRSIIGQYISAWNLENKRLTKNSLPIFSWDNEMIRFSVYQTLYLAAIIVFFGWTLVPYALAIALIGVLLLETINYIEHYGLRRKILPSGRPERVLPKHSWNSDHEMGRIVLFELTRHSDHHYLASRKYQILRHMDESPQLPTGYPGSMLMALVPPLWFYVMNKRLEDQSLQLEIA
ncbi:alkane 1-monooxygenase [Shivajiella indica]|uniref:Alkane 1-monooxygenase n=1 Tax=Shivajiella indica TaxID=872115 RepID=A0ABW5BDC8_9BACT